MADGDPKETRIVVEPRRRPRGSSASARRIDELETEGARHRARLREAKLKIENLTKQVPPEGSTILTADQTKVWKLVVDRKLDDPEKLTAALDKGEKLEKDLAGRDLDSVLGDISELEGFPLGTLRDLVTARGLKPEVREETVRIRGDDGKVTTEKVRQAYLGTGKQGDTPKKFADFIETDATDYADLLGSVEASEEGDRPSKDGVTTTGGETTRRISTQTSAAKGGTANGRARGGSGTPPKVHPAVQRVLDQNKARAEAPTVLRPAVPVVPGTTTK